jgi:NTP pyrophosphatase (non-canonical NTP hydrolase)
MSELSFTQLQTTNLSRATRWHKGGLEEWSINDWLVALGGEAGEACNAGKKHRRILSGLQQHGNVPTSLTEAEDKIMEELADTVTYADLIASRMGRSLADAIIRKFNAISEREGFPERLGVRPPATGVSIIDAERARQLGDEGFTAERDDAYIGGELSQGAACYADAASAMVRGASVDELGLLYVGFDASITWPWQGDGDDEETPKLHKNPIRNLAKAGAMIAAEIDRLIRCGCPLPSSNPAADVQEMLWNGASIQRGLTTPEADSPLEPEELETNDGTFELEERRF